MSQIIQLQMRRDSAADWTTDNPVLREGEIGYESDTQFHKIGDGSTAWTSLEYYHGPPWIQAVDGGSPLSTYPGAPFNPHGIMGTAPFIPPPVVMAKSVTHWRDIYAMGKHATDDKKIVFAGIPAFGNPLAIGILDRRDGTIVTIVDAFSTAGNMTSCSGIDCDPSTGVYVAQQANPSSSEYPSWWSTDLINWTQVTETGYGTAFTGGNDLFYDARQGLWWNLYGTKVVTSDDGKIFHSQKYDQNNSSFSMPQCRGSLPAGYLNNNQDLAFFGGNTEAFIVADNASQSGAPLVYTDVNAGMNPARTIFGPANPAMFGGVACSGDVIVVASPAGEMVYSTTGAINSWLQCAAKGGNTPIAGPTNEWIDGDFGGSMRPGLFTWVDGNWWAGASGGGTGDWFRYTGDIPIGDGWVMDNTGPMLDTNIVSTYMRDLNSCRLAFAAYTTNSVQVSLYYDEGDL